MRQVVLLTAVVALSGSLAGGVIDVRSAHAGGKGGAGGPERAFSGKILFSAKRFPSSARSPRAYTAALRKQKSDRFWENKERKLWKIHYAAFFSRPFNDLELTVKLWDVSTGRKQMVGSFEQYLEQRGDRVIISYLELEREHFGVNKRMQMTVEDHRGRVYATGNFKILGQEERLSGQVSFTEDETQGEIEYDND